ncbi:MAG: hypothetical protein K2X82_33795, partial [Gemmataceae bacterium]|nr:hypothetical protein [Gemmataceae bacterium]
LAAVVGVRPGAELPPVPDARLVLTADRPVPDPDDLPAPFEADPFRAVAGTIAELAPGDALLVLVPADWAGPSPEYLVEQGRRWRATHEAPQDGGFYPIDES